MIQDWISQDVLVNGATMHVVRTGGAQKPALVLAHGFSDNGLTWQPTAEDFEDRFDVIMPDARGHGLSARLIEGEQVDAAADLAGVLGALGVTSAIVGGHSMGAMTAAALGARFPGLVRALILEDPPWRKPEPGGGRSPRLSGDFFQRIAQQTPAESMAECRRDNPTWPEVVVQRWCEGKYQLDLNIFKFRGAFDNDWQQVAKAIACPTLMITGDPEKGGIITPELAAEILRMNAHFQVTHIPGVGHHIRFANYPAQRAALENFLAQVA